MQARLEGHRSTVVGTLVVLVLVVIVPVAERLVAPWLHLGSVAAAIRQPLVLQSFERHQQLGW